jgi:hypothetical protein
MSCESTRRTANQEQTEGAVLEEFAIDLRLIRG